MNDKRRKYAAEVSEGPELLDRYPASIHSIEKELVYRLTDPIVKETIKGECIVRFSETEQRTDFTTGLIYFRKYVHIEELVRCRDCKWWSEEEADHTCRYHVLVMPMKPSDYCSYGERRTDNA